MTDLNDNSPKELFCSSCYRYKAAHTVKAVKWANGKRTMYRCDSCDLKRNEAEKNRKSARK